MIDLSTPASRLAFVTPIALRHSLDPGLVCALCEHESSWDTWAMRYEPAFYGRYVLPLIPKENLTPTEAQARSTSYGCGQIMGQTARELGFVGKWLTELCDPETGIEFACRKLRKCFDIRNGLREVLLAYNGGSDHDYPASVISLMPRYRGL